MDRLFARLRASGGFLAARIQLQADYGVAITPWKLDSFCSADYRTFDLRVGI